MQTNLTFSSIFNQTTNFIRNRFWLIIIVSIIIGLFHVSITNYFMNNEAIEQLSNTRDTSVVFSSMLKMASVLIFSSLIIISVNIATIYNLSINDKFNINILLSKSVSSLIKVLGFNIIYMFIVLFIALFFSLIFFVLQMIVPTLGAIIAILFMVGLMLLMVTVYFFFIGSIINPSTKSFIQLFMQSHQLAKQYWQLGCLMIIINIICMIILSALAMTYKENNFILDFILATVSNLVDIFVICFFYRLTQLISDNETNLIENNPNNNLIL
ncbi:hypothetical protein A9G13_09385 [Gilliamella sp. wkB178]|uniref:hypothetical protein n=1 Tax=Gilliamella sp. wkB178 TaxID=3120259 RepID=UPI00080ED9CA|nr:hypothetical protein [Gilliamella apicola]OCG06483.1 hypothetical protein A9G13_09385 [Gilliamella apicola]